MSPTYVAIDDTDSIDGMCTTYLAAIMIDELTDFDLIGPPRLVRLNPNVPWKTRGNAAICMAFGHGRGRKIAIGESLDRRIYAYTQGSGRDEDELLSRAKEVVLQNAHLSCDKTNPGIVVSGKRPRPSLYWRAVREVIPLSEAEAAVTAVGGRCAKFKNGRGVIGAAAAMAWRPRDRTFELIAYRKPERIGSKREIDADSVDEMDRDIQSTFHNIDPSTKHIAIAPASPCPILYGVRGDDPNDLPKAKQKVLSEPIDKWLIFLTNQGTDDHLIRRSISGLRERQGAILTGEVSRGATPITGGHVFFEMRDGTASITCAVYEPSGRMRRMARELIEGNRITAYGSVRPNPFEFNIEKIWISDSAPSQIKVENPICPHCGKHMKSIGNGKGYRCRRCGLRAAENDAIYSPRNPLELGWYEPPVCSRRHLHKPAERFGNKRIPLREILYTWPVDESDGAE